MTPKNIKKKTLWASIKSTGLTVREICCYFMLSPLLGRPLKFDVRYIEFGVCIREIRHKIKSSESFSVYTPTMQLD